MLTTLHAGGKFGDGGGYKVSGGLHGVGVSVVNALSERLHLEIRRDGHVWTQDYERGEPQGDAEDGASKLKGTGTTITFLPDAEIFETLEFDFATLAERLRETAFLTRGLQIELIDERGGGERDRVPLRGRHRRLRQAPEREPRTRCTARSSTSRARPTTAQVEVAMQWNSAYQESIFSLRQQHQHPRGRHAPLRASARR